MENQRFHSRKHTLLRGVRLATTLIDQGAARSRKISRGRFLFFLLAAGTCFGMYQAQWYVAGNLALGILFLIFLIIAHYHNRFEVRLSRFRRWRDMKNVELAKMALEWQEMGGVRMDKPADHPYANDLDLTGSHSLLELLNATVSTHGRERLTDWVLQQHARFLDAGQWQERQALVRELTALPLFRDRLMLEATSIDPDTLNGHRIESLLDDPFHVPKLFPVLVTSGILAGLTATLAVFSIVGPLPEYWILSFGIYAWLFFSMAGYLEPVFVKVLALHQELQKLLAVFHVLEARWYGHTPHLAHLCETFVDQNDRPTQTMKSFAGICAALSIKGHPLVHLGINALMPWDLWFAHRLHKACAQLRPLLSAWLDRFATLDAAASLGRFAYLHPHYAWPVRRDVRPEDSSNLGVSARALGHPLLPHKQRVPNDLSLLGQGRILLVTGSNMSGKSTFLRTVGVNVCLAQAGAPVCAEWFEWTWMRLSCCIRINDSLDEGLSYFYAEVKRLRAILDAVKESDAAPVLYLIDEIFKGTNNRERLIGSEAFIRALAQGHGLGLLTTHDLELARLEQDLPGLQNVHFQETVIDGALHFDYWLRPGPCPTTNALRIMAQEGLPIPSIDEPKSDTVKEG